MCRLNLVMVSSIGDWRLERVMTMCGAFQDGAVVQNIQVAVRWGWGAAFYSGVRDRFIGGLFC